MFPRTLLAAAVAAPAFLAAPAEVKSARCFTSDDGEYACTFVATDRQGSFEISAAGRPAFSLVMEAPGVASGYGDYGNSSVALPGRYLRSRSDPACWENAETGARICAW